MTRFSILFFLFVTSINAFASVRALVWKSKDEKFVESTVPIKSLGIVSDSFFELRNFLFFKEFSSNPLTIDFVTNPPKSEKKLAFKASNVAYHVHLAESFFQNLIDSIGAERSILSEDSKMKIRLDVTYHFDERNYFNSDDREYNIARTIPPANPLTAGDYIQEHGQGWGTEIWFSPMLSLGPAGRYMPDMVIDTALCPDVIYHEYTHIISGKFLGGNKFVDVLTEGISDYFAASILNYTDLYTSKTCPYKESQVFNRSFDIDSREDLQYSPRMEKVFNHDLKFLPSMLWKIREIVGQKTMDKVVLSSIINSTSGMYLFPSFIDELSRNIEKYTNLETALTVENKIFIPHGLYSWRSYDKTIFSKLVHKKVLVKNTHLMYKRRVKNKLNQLGLCKQKDNLEINPMFFDLLDPLLLVKWNCDGYSVPFVIQMKLPKPTNLFKNRLSESISATWKLASLNIEPVDQKHAKILQAAKEYYLASEDNSRFMTVSYDQDSDVLTFNSDGGLFHPTYIRFEIK